MVLCPTGIPVFKEDNDLMQFSANLEFLEAEYFLWATHGYGLDVVAPELVMGGDPPIGVHKANLDAFTNNIISEFAMQEVGHLRALRSKVGGFPRPMMDLSAEHFAKQFDEAFGYKLEPPFDPYRDSLSFMLFSYAIPYRTLSKQNLNTPVIYHALGILDNTSDETKRYKAQVSTYEFIFHNTGTMMKLLVYLLNGGGGNGIPNSTHKYKEDQKVRWHATPFEERLEKAILGETMVSQRRAGATGSALASWIGWRVFFIVIIIA